MPADPIVDEIRRVRHEHAAKFNNDLAAIAADVEQRQQASGRTYVNFPPHRIAQPAIETGR